MRPPQELRLQSDSILKIIKPLYGVLEVGNHWFNTYHRHPLEKLSMTQSIYDLCLLYTDNNSCGFGIVGLQTEYTLFLADKTFAIKEEEQLRKAKLLAKKERNSTTYQSSSMVAVLNTSPISYTSSKRDNAETFISSLSNLLT